MSDWIVGFRKAARSAGPGVPEETLRALGFELPPELRALYLQVDGGELGEDLRVFRVAPGPGELGVQHHTGPSAAPFPPGLIRFGARGEGEHLVAGRTPVIAALLGERPRPSWLDSSADDGWAYALTDEHTGDVRLFRSLERLLWTVLPPVETEEFGESTFVRALHVVESALSDMKSGAQHALARAQNAVTRGRKKARRAAPALQRAAAKGKTGTVPKRAAAASAPVSARVVPPPRSRAAAPGTSRRGAGKARAPQPKPKSGPSARKPAAGRKAKTVRAGAKADAPAKANGRGVGRKAAPTAARKTAAARGARRPAARGSAKAPAARAARKTRTPPRTPRK